MTRNGSADPEPAPGATAVLTCPRCSSATGARMPENACVVRWDCPHCGAELRPEDGDCCVFCSYGSEPCPPLRDSASA